jgi:hypothetical protein
MVISSIEQAVDTLLNYFNMSYHDAVKVVRYIKIEELDSSSPEISSIFPKENIRGFNTTTFILNLLETSNYNTIRDYRYKLHQLLKDIIDESDYDFIINTSYLSGMSRGDRKEYK